MMTAWRSSEASHHVGTNNRRALLWCAASLATAMWSPALTKGAMALSDRQTFIALSYGMLAVGYGVPGVIAVMRRRATGSAPVARAWRIGVTSGLLACVGANCFMLALSMTTVSNAMSARRVTLVWPMLWSWFILHERSRFVPKMAGAAAMLAGALVIGFLK
jgi:drug/metabolite transporter (DMT)-like permease